MLLSCFHCLHFTIIILLLLVRSSSRSWLSTCNDIYIHRHCPNLWHCISCSLYIKYIFKQNWLIKIIPWITVTSCSVVHNMILLSHWVKWVVCYGHTGRVYHIYIYILLYVRLVLCIKWLTILFYSSNFRELPGGVAPPFLLIYLHLVLHKAQVLMKKLYINARYNVKWVRKNVIHK